MWIIALVLLLAAFDFIFYHFAFNNVFKKPKRSTYVPPAYKETPHYIESRKGMKIMDEIHCDDLFIKSFDDLKLHARLYYSPDGIGKKFILGIHGYKSYARPEFGPYIEFYRSLGFSMLLPDDRAHRPSEGEYITLGVHDRIDCVYWANYLVQRFGEDVEIYLHGVSMGAATVLAASSEEDLPLQVKGIIADCGYTCIRDELSYQLKKMHFPVNYALSKLEKMCIKKIGFGFCEYSPVEQVKNAKAPILVVHGGKDQMVPPHMAREIYEAVSSRKMLLEVPEAIHAESICIEREKYQNTIREFFNI